MGCGLLADLSPQAIRRMCPSAELCTFRHKAVIYSRGWRLRNLFCLRTGKVRLARGDREENELTVGFINAVELFGP